MISQYLDGNLVATVPLSVAQAVSAKLQEQGFKVREFYSINFVFMFSPKGTK